MGDAALAVVAAEEALPRSEYELQKQGSIARNKRTMIQLGLDKPAITQKAAPKPKAKSKAIRRAAERARDPHGRGLEEIL